jgi:hypothetical protein
MSEQKNSVILVDKDYMWLCPWCDGQIQCKKNQVGCKIFRHAVYKNNKQSINPHASEEECKELLDKNLIDGCAKPFRFVFQRKTGKHYVVKCDYI